MLRCVVRAAALLLPTLVVGAALLALAACGADAGSSGDACDAPRATCNGICVDLATDSGNCGACDRNCFEFGSCVAGECVSHPGGPPPDGTGVTVLAIRHLYFGDTDRDDNLDPQAWKRFGLNLDRLVTGPKSTDVCAVVTGASPAQVKTDGTGGIDNSFGENIIPIVVGLTSDLFTTANVQIASGRGTQLIALDKLGFWDTYYPIQAALFTSASLTAKPRWDGTDVWPIARDSVSGGDASKPTTVFPLSYTSRNTWVSSYRVDPAAVVVVSVRVLDGLLRLRIHGPTVAMDLAADHKSATNGTIAGVLDTEELVADLTAVAGSISPALCPASTLDSIIEQLRQASDILKDGTQDPTKTCDGISIGLGFDAVLAQLGAVASPEPPPPDPCAAADAGNGG